MASNTESYDPYQYVRLRTILDSLEDGSIRYYLGALNSPEGPKRFGEIESRLMPIIEWLWGGPGALGCPPGYSNCNGVCVPYTCPPDPPEAKAAKY